ncbi:MAG: hypothetical protein ABS76_00170 [Pelagibacterium sp. SCN 64-44]|nr:MAG: hypothetical protein ABS76_00170 [Pelagibacterium sp. SCN 64-44]
MAFAAPDFLGVIRLRHRLAQTPHLRRMLCFVPEQALRDYLTEAASPALIATARQNLARHWPYACAQLELTRGARWGFMAGVLLLVVLLLVAPYLAPLWLLPFSFILLLAPAAIRLAAVASPRLRPKPARRPPDEELPVYSVLIPLRNEAGMVRQLFTAMAGLDYPAARLDIKFVVEAQSAATVAAVRAQLGDPQFSLVAVPDAAPRTKPKALDFALPLCRGQHVVVFDAEDRPEPDQLWKAALRFREEPDIVCLQAPLVIDNGRDTPLAALFSGEYASLFGVFLPALTRWRWPVPLGGTSNHFRIDALRRLGGWDAFNVTEDADLGMRLARRRLRVEMLDAATHEAAPTHFRPWLGQRTRWMKGWMQTFIVHNRDPGRLLAEMGPLRFLAFQVLVLGMILAPVLHCAYAALLVWLWLGGHLGWDGSPLGVYYLALLGLGYGSTLAMTVLGLMRVGRLHLLPSQILLPFYWLLMGLATFRAARELLVAPFYWFKSPHRPVKAAAPSSRSAPAEARR